MPVAKTATTAVILVIRMICLSLFACLDLQSFVAMFEKNSENLCPCCWSPPPQLICIHLCFFNKWNNKQKPHPTLSRAKWKEKTLEAFNKKKRYPYPHALKLHICSTFFIKIRPGCKITIRSNYQKKSREFKNRTWIYLKKQFLRNVFISLTNKMFIIKQEWEGRPMDCREKKGAKIYFCLQEGIIFIHWNGRT